VVHTLTLPRSPPTHRRPPFHSPHPFTHSPVLSHTPCVETRLALHIPPGYDTQQACLPHDLHAMQIGTTLLMANAAAALSFVCIVNLFWTRKCGLFASQETALGNRTPSLGIVAQHTRPLDHRRLSQAYLITIPLLLLHGEKERKFPSL